MSSSLSPHRRLNSLTGEWVLVSPQRTLRPWQGQVEGVMEEDRVVHDPNCYLCPGNTRASGEVNPDYLSTFTFQNDFSALSPLLSSERKEGTSDLFQSKSVSGECRVICFSPRHDLTLAEMEITDIEMVVKLWKEQTLELGKNYEWVQIFENKGEIMGCSNPHPHGQIWASDQMPTYALKEHNAQETYFVEHGLNLLQEVVRIELEDGSRLVEVGEHWVAFVPFWAVWPFETLLVPRVPLRRMSEISGAQSGDLAMVLKRLLGRYDKLFANSFPYSMGWHGAPFMPDYNGDAWTLHAHFYPPLLRSATVKKFMVGYEMLGESQRDLTPEQAAEMLRMCS